MRLFIFDLWDFYDCLLCFGLWDTDESLLIYRLWVNSDYSCFFVQLGYKNLVLNCAVLFVQCNVEFFDVGVIDELYCRNLRFSQLRILLPDLIDDFDSIAILSGHFLDIVGSNGRLSLNNWVFDNNWIFRINERTDFNNFITVFGWIMNNNRQKSFIAYIMYEVNLIDNLILLNNSIWRLFTSEDLVEINQFRFSGFDERSFSCHIIIGSWWNHTVLINWRDWLIGILVDCNFFISNFFENVGLGIEVSNYLICFFRITKDDNLL